MQLSVIIKSLLVPMLVGIACQKSGEEEAVTSADTSGRPIPLTQDLPPIPGSGPAFTRLEGADYELSWAAASDDVTKASKLQYKVISADTQSELATLSNALPIQNVSVVKDWGSDLSVTITEATGGQPVFYAVLVRDEVGNMALYPGTTIDIETLDLPVAGTGIVASDVTESGFTASWGQATSKTTAQENLEYRAVISGTAEAIDTVAEALAIQDGSMLFDWTPNLLTFPLTGLTGSTNFFVTVLVRSEAGLFAKYGPIALRTANYKLIFKTNAIHLPTVLASAASADAKCNAERPAGRGTFKAMIGTVDRKACSTPYCGTGTAENQDWAMAGNRTYENASGQVLWTTNVNGIVDFSVQHPAISSGLVWTGLNADFTRSSDSCMNWVTTSSSVTGVMGTAGSLNGGSLNIGSLSCNAGGSIYCVEQ